MMKDYFHGGVPDLPVGGFILPPAPDQVTVIGLYDHTRAYVTTDFWTALMSALQCAVYFGGNGRAAVYRVKPIGRLLRDENCPPGVPCDDFRCRKALILARLDIPPALIDWWKAGGENWFDGLWPCLMPEGTAA
jgi:hypothetical protein